MSDVAIRAAGLGKRYRIGAKAPYKTLREAITGALRAPLKMAANSLRGIPASARTSAAELVWALRNIEFEIKQGQAVGIIGRNGAGKSTLLKVLAQVTEPTEGYAEIRGRVGSLLEVGVGFHPELTGRENIYLNGSLLGMRKAEIDRNFDEIVAFAEVEQFLDTPVKHYSSGMYVRLGFAVAAHLQTEILFVDEVLSVGDVAFQEKCLGKMKDVAGGGRTVLFVSHNLLAVQALCEHALWLDKGALIAEGRPVTVVSSYLEQVRNSKTQISYDESCNAPGNDEVRVRRASVRPLSTNANGAITVRSPLQIEFEFWNRREGALLDCGMNVFNQYGIHVLTSGTVDSRSYPAGVIRVRGQIPGDLLNTGVYRVELIISRGAEELILSCPDLLVFEVADCLTLRGVYYGDWPGVVRPKIQWNAEVLE